MSIIGQLRENRTPLATLPTPLEEAGRLSTGRRVLIKRDDLTGLGMGGNKARKLEFLATDALVQHADVLATVGAAQSNHARVTAAAGARLGLETHLVLGGTRSDELRGNQLLGDLFGAHLHYADTSAWSDLTSTLHTLVSRLRADGRNPYSVPLGGSTPIGASSFVLAWAELLDQLEQHRDPVAAVVVASSTGGTHAGMVAGRVLLGGPRIVAVDVAKESDNLAELTTSLANETLEHLGSSSSVTTADVEVDGRFTGEAYAVPTVEADTAMAGLARSGGWVLDRVYTAKAFAGLLALDAAGELPAGDVVFWHTGGQPAVFAESGAPILAARGTLPVLTTQLEHA